MTIDIINPKSIQVSKTGRTLTILWQDDHLSIYNFGFMRRVCPCVECKGGHAKMGILPDKNVYTGIDEINPQTSLDRIVHVGSYAISIQWEDGHSAGIYTWKYLRGVCSCTICMDNSGSE